MAAATDPTPVVDTFEAMMVLNARRNADRCRFNAVAHDIATAIQKDGFLGDLASADNIGALLDEYRDLQRRFGEFYSLMESTILALRAAQAEGFAVVPPSVVAEAFATKGAEPVDLSGAVAALAGKWA